MSQFKYKTIKEAARKGDLKELKRMHESKYGGFTGIYELTAASISGNIECLKYLHIDKGVNIIQYALQDMILDNDNITQNNIECIKYCINNCGRITDDFIDFLFLLIADRGLLELIKYLYELNYKPYKHFTSSVCSYGQIDVLKYAYTINTEFTNYTVINSAFKGNINCFIFCFEIWQNKQDFINIEFDETKIVDKIDLDMPIWRRNLIDINLDLSKHALLQDKINNKLTELKIYRELSIEVLQNYLPLDIIKYCINIYL